MLFRYRAAGSVEVSVRGASDADVAAGAVERSSVVTTESRRVASRELARMFSLLALGRLLPRSLHRTRDFDWAREYVTRDGALRTRRPDGQFVTWNPPLSIFPAVFRDYVTGVRAEAIDLVRRTIAALEWRSGRRASRHGISAGGDEWSRDGRQWRSLPSDYGVGWVEAYGWSRIPELALEEVAQRVQSGRSAPIGHVLLVEARDLATRNPRASLLVGASAAEVWLKDFIAHAVPAARWLVFNAPSPPSDEIVASYLPQLLAELRHEELQVPRELRRALKSGFEKRNRVVHGRDDSVGLDELREFLQAVDSLLRLLDYAGGAEWAATFIGRSRPQD